MRQHWWESIRKRHTALRGYCNSHCRNWRSGTVLLLLCVSKRCSVFINFGFVACCIGGMGSIPGAVIGGVLMGIMDTVVGTYTNAALKYLAVFALFLFVVYKRPKGLFGW